MDLKELRAGLRKSVGPELRPLCSFCVRGKAAKPEKATCIVLSSRGAEWWACATHAAKHPHRISPKTIDDYFSERGKHGPLEMFK